MERLTIRDGMIDFTSQCTIEDAKRKLKEYEDAEEAGTLVRLPCKECYSQSGNTVYLIDGGEIIRCIHCGLQIDAHGNPFAILDAGENIFPYRDGDAEHDTDPFDWCTTGKQVAPDDFGKTVFQTMEEAEKALEEMENL